MELYACFCVFLPLTIIAVYYICVFRNECIMDVAFKNKWNDLSVRYIYYKMQFIKHKTCFVNVAIEWYSYL